MEVVEGRRSQEAWNTNQSIPKYRNQHDSPPPPNHRTAGGPANINTKN